MLSLNIVVIDWKFRGKKARKKTAQRCKNNKWNVKEADFTRRGKLRQIINKAKEHQHLNSIVTKQAPKHIHTYIIAEENPRYRRN